jgi:hypothetical protein
VARISQTLSAGEVNESGQKGWSTTTQPLTSEKPRRPDQAFVAPEDQKSTVTFQRTNRGA